MRWMIRGSIPEKGNRFSFSPCQNIQTRSVEHPASSSMATREQPGYEGDHISRYQGTKWYEGDHINRY